jgi:hypothetical protein
VFVPELLGNGWIQTAILGICVLIGVAICIKTLGERSGQMADMYHDIIIGPVILFFAVTLVPIIWYNARWYEGLAVILATIVWASLVYIDFKYERMNQRQWLVNHGFAIKGEIPKH